MTSPITTSARIMAELRERLKAQYEGLEDGDETLETTLDGASDLPELLGDLLRRAARAEAYAEAMKAIIAANIERKARFERQSESLSAQVSWALQEAGKKKLQLPDMTVSLSDGMAPLIIPNEGAVPAEWRREVVGPPDRTEIRAALAFGEKFSWAYLGQASPKMTIRRR